MTNDELMAQAQAWGFNCHQDEGGKLQIFPIRRENNAWYLSWDGQYWVMFSRGIAALNFCPEDAKQFLAKQRQP